MEHCMYSGLKSQEVDMKLPYGPCRIPPLAMITSGIIAKMGRNVNKYEASIEDVG